MTPTNWTPGLVALAAGLGVAIAYLLFTKSATLATPGKDDKRDDLDRRVTILMDQLKELVAEKHTVTPERFEAEKARLELEAAAAMRARDEAGKVRKAPQQQAIPQGTGFFARNPSFKGALWGAGVVLFFGVLGYVLISEQKVREDDMTATGKMPPGAGPMRDAPNAELDAARARMNARPDDLEAASFLAHELIRMQGFQEATDITERSLALDPFHVETRVHRQVLRASQGDVDGAIVELERIVDLYPGAQEGLLFLGAIAMQNQDAPRALTYFERFSVEVPADQRPPQLMAAIAQLRQRVGK